MLKDDRRAFCGTQAHVYELYLAPNDLEHRRTKVHNPQPNGFVARFHRTVLAEFFALVLRAHFYEAVETLQADLDRWLVHYNTERPHRGNRTVSAVARSTPCSCTYQPLDRKPSSTNLVSGAATSAAHLAIKTHAATAGP